MSKNTVTIHGKEFTLEERQCAYCDKLFKVQVDSLHSTCGLMCWQFNNGKIWKRGDKQPKIRYPGEAKKAKKSAKKAPLPKLKDTIGAEFRAQVLKKEQKAKALPGRSTHRLVAHSQ